MKIFFICCVLLFVIFVDSTAFPQPVAFWTFSALHNGTDLSGNENHAILSNVDRIEGPFGSDSGGLTFNGQSTSKVNIPNSGDFIMQSFTYAAYVRAGTGNIDAGPYLQWIANSWAVHIWNYPNRYDLHVGLGSTMKTKSNAFSDNEWVHIAVSYNFNNGDLKIYKNGTEIYNENYGQPAMETLTNGNLEMGYSFLSTSSGRSLGGAVGCTLVYNETLTAEQIQETAILCRTYSTGQTGHNDAYVDGGNEGNSTGSDATTTKTFERFYTGLCLKPDKIYTKMLKLSLIQCSLACLRDNNCAMFNVIETSKGTLCELSSEIAEFVSANSFERRNNCNVFAFTL